MQTKELLAEVDLLRRRIFRLREAMKEAIEYECSETTEKIIKDALINETFIAAIEEDMIILDGLINDNRFIPEENE